MTASFLTLINFFSMIKKSNFIQPTAVSHTTISSDKARRECTSPKKRGDSRYHYAKITIPSLAAGELRVLMQPMMMWRDCYYG